MITKNITKYVSANIVILLLTFILVALREQLNITTVALVFLMLVLFIAMRWGRNVALLSAVVSAFCFNYFFIPPVGTLSIAATENWVALAAFLATAIVVGQLSARAKEKASEAEAKRIEISKLYSELNEAFEKASQAEALRRSEQLKTALLDAITHNLRTPLTSIKASVTTLLANIEQYPTPTLDEQGKHELLEIIDEESDRLNKLIEDLVETAGIQANAISWRRAIWAVNDIINSALERADPLLCRHKINISFVNELPLLFVDGQAISEVIYTLLDNASKYSPENTIIKIIVNEKDGNMHFVVEDEGPGIPEIEYEKVFEKFYRSNTVDCLTSQRPQGIGLGLAIAKGIIDAHNGKIYIEKTLTGIGTQVVFTLPIGD